MRILREPEVQAKTNICRQTRWRWEKEGLFPKRVSFGPNTSGHLEHEIDEWIKSRAAARSESPSTPSRPRGRPRKHLAAAE
jgi:prophage regulatory protein